MKLASMVSFVSGSLLAVGCAGDDAGMGPIDPDADVEQPTVVSTTPTMAQSGIGANAFIEITFSEPMDPATVIGAYNSAELSLDKVSTTWNSEQTVLTIKPNQPLEYGYGTGDDPATADRQSYTVTIGDTATDLAGNKLAAPLALTFSTKVRMHTMTFLVDSLSRSTLGGTTLGEAANLQAGDSTLSNAVYRGYASFNLALVHPSAVVESASLSAMQIEVEGTPYQSFGALKLYHLSFTEMAGIGDVLPLSMPGNLSEDGDIAMKSIDVTSQVADDIANRVERGNLSQYRFAFETATDGDNEFDRAIFDRDTFVLTIDYIAD